MGQDYNSVGKRCTIGVLIGNANSPHTTELMKGIYHAAEFLDVNVIYFLGIHSSYFYRAYFGKDDENDYDYQFNIVYDYALLSNVDALIISFGTLSIFLENHNKQGFLQKFQNIPYVLIEDTDETRKGTSIIADNYSGMYRIVDHLVTVHNRKSFVFLSGPKGNTDAEQRCHAFHDVLEQYGLPHEEGRVAYGDFSPCVEPQIHDLLDRYPDLDAFVCANDMMADTVYRELKKRGLIIGKSISVTGYDDWDVAKSMDPPLTTVLQNSYDMGYMAVIGAVELYDGKKPHSIVVPAKSKIRRSCGCEMSKNNDFLAGELWDSDNPLDQINQVTDIFVNRIVYANSSFKIRQNIRRKLIPILSTDLSNSRETAAVLEQLTGFLNCREAAYISFHELLHTFDDYLDVLISRHITAAGYNDKLAGAAYLKESIRELIFDKIIKTSEERNSAYQQETWFLPLISREMMAHLDSEKDFYRSALNKLSALQAKSTYLYIFEEPMIHRKNDRWICPDRMYLAAAQIGEKIYGYEPEKRPVVTAENGFTAFNRKESSYSMSVFCLYSGDVQYGIMVTEIEPDRLSLFYLISMQIANALKFNELTLQQRKTQLELEDLLHQLNEKNQVLSFISEYDVLTGCLNRRGFVERIMEYNKAHIGETVQLIFADLDHLKEINDKFGHNEGDFAIQSASELLEQFIGTDGILGRIGGDEFVAVMNTSPDARDPSSLRDELKQLCEQFNQQSAKPFYVEITIGCLTYRCQQEMVISDILNKADRSMYLAKQFRRKSIVKQNPEEIKL